MKSSDRIVPHASYSAHRSAPSAPVRPPNPLRFPRISVLTAAAALLFAGIFAGTVWIGLMPDSLKEQLNFFGQLQPDATHAAFEPALLLNVFLRREMQAGFLWLIGMTAFSVPVLLLTALYCGFSSAALVSLMTVQAGLWGLPLYLASVLPQALFYLPAAAILFFWGLEPSKKTHLAGFLILSALIALGAFAECFLNPFVLKLLSFAR